MDINELKSLHEEVSLDESNVDECARRHSLITLNYCLKIFDPVFGEGDIHKNIQKQIKKIGQDLKQLEP